MKHHKMNYEVIKLLNYYPSEEASAHFNSVFQMLLNYNSQKS